MRVCVGVQGGEEDVEGAMASIFVWLRYSAARHLTWQRNYNTQPRILGEAQAKLTHKIAEVSLALLNLLSECTPGLHIESFATQKIVCVRLPVSRIHHTFCLLHDFTRLVSARAG